MKKLRSTFRFILLIGIVVVFTQCRNSTTNDNSTGAQISSTENHEYSQVKAYYFHGTRRCATCMAVEAVSKEAIKEYYGNKVIFESINGEEESDNPLLMKYKITGTALLIVNGDEKADLTNEAFLNARTNPDQFKSKLKSTIDSML